ncbi:hypothetical protein V6D40_05190 [Corynebacterium sp. Q4381]|uniref:hypothetical protein n=1 Tax=Corynebacterium sp. Marseille-Q4381 TaxID=3121597 RepID=UPI002FE5B37F
MRLRRFAVLGAVGSAAVVSGCAGGGTQETILFTSTQWVPGEAAGTPTASSAAASEAAESATTPAAGAWKNEYAWVLDHPGDYPVNSAARYDPVGTYHYALVEMTGDDTPEMLLMVDSKEYSPIIVFTVGADGKAAGSTDVLIAGASGAGGSRARVEASESGNGLYQVDSHSVQPDAYSKLYKLSGRSLTAASDSVEFENADLLPDHRFIAWTKSTDRSALHAGKPTYAGATSITEYTPFPDAAPEKVAPDKVAPAKPASSAVGTVRDMSGEELAALAGDFQYGPEERYLVLHLDEVAAISGIRGAESSPSTVTTQTILLGTKTQGANFKLAGRRIELSLDPDVTRFANDPSAPYATAIVPPTDGFVYLD